MIFFQPCKLVLTTNMSFRLVLWTA